MSEYSRGIFTLGDTGPHYWIVVKSCYILCHLFKFSVCLNFIFPLVMTFFFFFFFFTRGNITTAFQNKCMLLLHKI